MAASKIVRQRARRKLAWKKRAAAGFFLAAAFLLAAALQAMETHGTVFAEDGKLRVWVFDVGQGDAIFIETPTGEQILVDSGKSAKILSKLGSVMKPWDRSLDAIVVTHPDSDHFAAMVDVLRSYSVASVYDTGQVDEANLYEAYWEAVRFENAKPIIVESGAKIVFGDVVMTIVAPDSSYYAKQLNDTNMGSIVLLLEYGETSILLTGDAPKEMEAEILNDIYETVDVLKVAHHGSVNSTSDYFLDAVRPGYGIISVGKNSYGHPHPVLLDRLASRDVQTFRTDLDGDVLILSDGGEPVVQASPLPF